MNRLIYVGNKIVCPQSGAEQINLRNQILLDSIFHGQITYIEFHGAGFLNKLSFNANRELLQEVRKELEKGDCCLVFISQSLLGRVAQYIKQKFPSVRIVTFFHNIEIHYATAYVRARKIKAWPFYLLVKYWEKVACRNTDIFITLNRRDSRLLKQYYDCQAATELPTSFNDIYDKNQANSMEDAEPIDYLFVGVAFFANIHGIQWFIDNVMPHVNGHLYVIGKGMQDNIFRNLSPRIHIQGFVTDLSLYYYRARFVVSPIFIGGGMKTKTAEALMYGKTILGTEEAFEGYEIDKRCMLQCDTAEDFVKNINTHLKEDRINPYARTLFLEHYSNEVAREKLCEAFKHYV